MPAPKTMSNANAEYVTIRRESLAMNETNDCAVVAVAAVSGVSYTTAHIELAKAGRKARHGTYTHQYHSVLRKLGFKLTEVPMREFIDRYPGCHKNLRTVTTHQPERFNEVWADGHNYLFETRRHVLAVVNGQNVDWTKGKAKRVRSVWRVEKAN